MMYRTFKRHARRLLIALLLPALLCPAALADVSPRSSWRASREFRLQLVEELSGRAFAEAARKGGAAL